MGFDPAFPNLAHFEPGDSTEGRWSMRLGGVMVTGGTYDLLRVDSSVAVGLDVTDPWRPAGLPPAMARLFADVDVGIARGALDDRSGTLRRLIGRPTTPLARSVAEALRRRA
jgi:hypothetical protein